MLLRMKTLIFWGSLKNPTFRGVSPKTNIEGGLPKKRGLGKFVDLRGGLARKREGCFRGGIDTPMYTISYPKII